jgi:anti-sigma factor RsiW
MSEDERQTRTLLLQADFDQELDAAGALEAERLLAVEARAREDRERLEALRRTLRRHAAREAAPEALRTRLLAQMESASGQGRIAASYRHLASPSWRVFASSIAATIVVTLGLQHLAMELTAPDRFTPYVVAGHMRSQISGQPVDVASSDRHTVKPWLAGKLPLAVTVVDLAAEGFPLAGARIDIVGSTPVPTLVYKRREHLVSVAELQPRSVNYPEAPSLRMMEGYPVVVWKEKHRAYAAISDLPPAELEAFVAAFRRAASEIESEPARQRASLKIRRSSSRTPARPDRSAL